MNLLFKTIISILSKYLPTVLYILFISCSSDPSLEKDNNLVNVQVYIEGQGNVMPANGTYIKNNPITFEATAAPGYYFDRWLGFDKNVENSKYEFILSRDLYLRAIFLPLPKLSDEVKVYEPKKIDPNPVFIIENGGTKAYLTSKTGEVLQEWNFNSKLGNDIEMTPDGGLIGLFKSDEVSFSFGGYGGTLKKFSQNGNIEWEYELNSTTELSHHDFELIPNGNVLILVWECLNKEQAKSIGFNGTGPIYLEKIIEIDPVNQKVIWEWRSFDHLIQDFDSNALNFGVISEHPEKINLNYHNSENGDLMHANGLFYDKKRDMIYLSVNFYSEVWAIPHNYDTITTKTDKGDLNFRFGNPEAYNSLGKRLFFNNHHPSLVTLNPETIDNFLIFMNGKKDNQSIVYEFILPSKFDLNPKEWTTPEEFWNFTESDLYYEKISGALRLPNGNTLICEGDYGYWEVTPQGDVVWKYEGKTTFWRGYVYPGLN